MTPEERARYLAEFDQLAAGALEPEVLEAQVELAEAVINYVRASMRHGFDEAGAYGGVSGAVANVLILLDRELR